MQNYCTDGQHVNVVVYAYGKGLPYICAMSNKFTLINDIHVHLNHTVYVKYQSKTQWDIIKHE